jgi:hypothetical protein
VRFSCRSALHDVQHALQAKWLSIPADVRGHHAQLIAIAADLADGGRIAGARGWSVPQWYQRAGFHPRYQIPRLEAHGLARWEGDDLVVMHYVVNHERRLRWLFHRGPELTAIRLGLPPPGRGIAPPSASSLALGSQRVNCAKTLTSPPTVPSTVPCNGAVNGIRIPPLSPALPSGTDPRSGSLRNPTSGPPGPPGKGSRARARERPGRSSGPARPPGSLASRLEHRNAVQMAVRTDGPEGFERWVTAMPVIRGPRSEATARRWREENLEYWVKHDLEGEADEICAELEQRKGSEAWSIPRFIPSPINFLRAATWRQRPTVRAPKVWGPPEVFEPSTTWRPPEAAREDLNDYLKGLADGKVLS